MNDVSNIEVGDEFERTDKLPDRLLYPVTESREKLGGISHSKFYDLVRAGKIKLVKIGTRSFVTGTNLEQLAVEGAA